jgi:hypothetical protein
MKVGQVQVIGVRPYEKDDKKSWTLYGMTPFEDWETGGLGFKTIEEWTNRVDLGFLKPGDVIELQYSKGFKGAAVLSNVMVVTKK